MFVFVLLAALICFQWVCEKRTLLVTQQGFIRLPCPQSTIKPERVTLSRCTSPSPAILRTSSHLNMLWRFHLLWILLSRAGQFCSLFLELYRTAKPKHFARWNFLCTTFSLSEANLLNLQTELNESFVRALEYQQAISRVFLWTSEGDMDKTTSSMRRVTWFQCARLYPW